MSARLSDEMKSLLRAVDRVHAARSIDEVLSLVAEETGRNVGAHRASAQLTTEEAWAQDVGQAVIHSSKLARGQDCHERPAGSDVDDLARSLAASLTARDGRDLGLIRVSDKIAGDFDEDDEIILAHLANAASATIECLRNAKEKREVEAHFRLPFERAAVGLTVWDSAGGLVQANEALRAILGRSADEVLAFDYLTLTHPDDRERNQALFDQLIAGEIPSYMIEKRYLRKDGAVVWVRNSVSPVHDDAGAIVRVVALSEDITSQKVSEAENARKADLVRLAGRLARMGAWSVDLLAGEIYWSDEVCSIHEVPAGASPSLDEAIGFYAPEWRETIRDAFRRCAKEGVPYDLELELLTATGKRLWVRAIGEAERDDSGRIVGVKGAFQDIDQLKKSEDEARALAQRLTTTLESITDAFFTVDRDWRFTYINPQAERLLLRRRSDLIGKVLWDEFPEAVDSSFWHHYQKSMSENVKTSVEDYYPPLAIWVRVNVYSSDEGLAVYFQDVTEQRRAREALQESEARFRIIAKATADTLWDWDMKADSLWWSDGLLATFGYDPAELDAGREWWSERIHPEDRERVLQDIRHVIEGSAENWTHEYRFMRADGSYAQVVARGFVMRDDQGDAVRMLGGMTDVSQTRELEERLQHAQRLEAIGHLTGGVAHDFNNMLLVIMNNAYFIAEMAGDDEKIRPMADTVLTAAKRSANLTQKLLSFARHQPLQPQSLDLNGFIEEWGEMLRRTLREDIEVERRLVDDLPSCYADPSQLNNAILNIVNNAQDAMPEGGRIWIETAEAVFDQGYAARHSEVAPGRYLMLAISDSGKGMPPDVCERCFEPFFTTKESSQGSGLGLSMVYGFAKQTGGHASVYSELGQGTTIKLYLPTAEGDSATTPETEDVSGLPRGEEHVLVVEDEELVRAQVVDMIGSLGYRVSAAKNGPEALEVFEQADDVDILFTDVVLPGGMNGRQIAEALSERRPDLAVVFTSGYTEDVVFRDGRLDPSVHLLSKPYDKARLAQTLRKVRDTRKESKSSRDRASR